VAVLLVVVLLAAGGTEDWNELESLGNPACRDDSWPHAKAFATTSIIRPGESQ
jgi:hypothetical protein